MSDIVLDTCALLWLTCDPSQLSKKANRSIARAEKLVVASISIWEIGVKAKKRKLDLGVDFDEYVERVSRAEELEIVPVDHRLWAASIGLAWSHRDPADRVIVALAQRRDLSIVTDDSTMRSFYRRAIF